jgi:hypothetical protein
MNDQELHDLERADTWDFEAAEKSPPATKPRAVVSVAFAREEYERVASRAEQVGKKTSEFIRDAAMQEARRPLGVQTTALTTTASLGVVTPQAVRQAITRSMRRDVSEQTGRLARTG